MHLRRFLGKLAGTFLAVGAISASGLSAADIYPGHDPVAGGWGHAPVYGDAGWEGAHQGAGPGVWDGSHPGVWDGAHPGAVAWEGSHPGVGGSCCPPPCPSECCHEPCHEPPACGVAYNPNGYFFCNNCNNECGNFWDSLRFRADFLWWRACEDDLVLGTEEIFSSFPNGSNYQKSRLKSPDFKYDPGFRIGLNTICPCDCWDVALNWTHFHTKAEARGESTFTPAPITNNVFEESIFVSEWERLANAVPDSIKGKWTLNLDLLDLEFGHKYYVSKCFILRPHLGLRGARVNQSFRVASTANRTEPYQEGGNAFFASDTKAKNNFLAIGPRVGVDLELRLPCCITLFGQAAASLVFGRFERHAKEYFQDFETVDRAFPPAVAYDGNATLERCSRGITDLSIGLKWEHCCTWCNRSHPLSIVFAWEHHAFYDFNNFIFDQKFTQGASTFYGGRSRHGDLTTQGLTVNFDLGF